MNKEAIKSIIEKIVNEDFEELSFYRSFSKNNAVAGVLVKRMNESLYDYPSTTDTIICLHLYPAIKWVVSCGNAYDIVQRFQVNDCKISQLSQIQEVIQSVIGIRTELKLNSREEYFKSCKKFVACIENIVETIGGYPHMGKKYQAILQSFLGIDDSKKSSTPSIYYVNQNAKSLLCFLADYYGNVFEESLNDLLSGRAIADDDVNKVYHNIELLLREYNKILWHKKHSKDKAMQLLACGNAMEMDKITQNDSKYFQASTIVDYIKFIRGAIEAVRSFPVMGEEYYKILSAIVELKSQCLSDKEISYRLKMSTYSYSVKRKKALAVLSAVLWGVDGDIYVKMLTDK